MTAAEFAQGICQDCLSGKPPTLPTYTWPDIDEIGLPNLTVGLFGASMEGIEYTQDYLPIDPGNLPSIPTLDIFIDGFTTDIKFPDGFTGALSYGYPEIDLGGGFSLPEVPIPPGIDPEAPGINWSLPGMQGVLGLFELFIKFPFEVIKLIIQKIIDDLVLEIPTVSVMTDLFVDLAVAIGVIVPDPELPQIQLGLENLAFCCSKTLKDLLDEELI